ncbi:MAG: hypothetical protein HQ522_09000 [Bacteroidetes bacterium]|nr:hypothetical protein [Bacteroidota bacterium]
MTHKALADQNYELIKQHILDPENSQLPENLKYQLDRIVSATKLLDKNPVKKNAVALHRRKYSDISLALAYRDLDYAGKMFNTYHKFDWDVWQNWLLQNIVETIHSAQNDGSVQAMKIITAAQANLIKAIGEKPTDIQDPNRHEKNQFFLTINLGGKQPYNIDLENMDKLPPATLKELNKVLFAGREITDVEFDEMLDS